MKMRTSVTEVGRPEAAKGRLGVASVLLAVAFGAGLLGVACSRSDQPAETSGEPASVAKPGEAYTADRVGCATFTAEDAAGILGVPATEIQTDAQELYAGNWQCSFQAASTDAMVSFNLSLAESVDDAIADMAQYRSHLEIARGTEPFKEDLAEGAYVDVDDLGDEALWTAANETLAVRKTNVSLQVQFPDDRDLQVEVARKFLAHL